MWTFALTPALSPGERVPDSFTVAFADVEGRVRGSVRFTVPTRGFMVVEASHEPAPNRSPSRRLSPFRPLPFDKENEKEKENDR